MSETIAAVVVTYNRKDLLVECIEALLAQTRPLDRIILVDNASTDGTPEMLHQRGYLPNPLIGYIRLDQNTGGSGGFFTGIKYGYEQGFDRIWLMDDDAQPAGDALEKLVASTATRKRGIGVCRVVNGDGTLQKRVLESVYENDRLFAGVMHSSLNDMSVVYSYPLLGILVSRPVLQRTGNLRYDYFIQADDLEWTLRLSKPNGIAYVTDAVLVHHDHVTFLECRRMRHTIRYLARKDLWKDYYGLRNWILTARSAGMQHWRLYATKRYLRILWQRFLVRRDFTLAMMLYSKSLYHGLTGRSGKRVEPGHGAR